ncbi:MAG: ABC transporter substrate-binding protein [Anaerolineae bacterium]|jgi:peptide/nickel transport system substrate-binding protein
MHRNRNMVWIYPLLMGLLIVALALAGCGLAAEEAPDQETAPGEEDGRTGILRVAAQPISQTDPALITSEAEVLVASHIYDYLVDIDAANEIRPRLATEWTISEDGRIYTFTLAEGVLFHDGTPLRPEDVVWTFDRLRDPELGLPTADLYGNIDTIQVTGERQVTFTLQEPNPFFLYDLSDNHALILQEGAEDAATRMNGTGPFVVVDYRPEDRMLLQANDAYFMPDQPQVAELEIIFFADDAAAADALRGGQVDLRMNLSVADYEALRAQPDLVPVEVPTNRFTVIRIRTDRAPGDDERVVRALRLATDRQALFDLALQGYGSVGRDSPIGPLYEEYYAEDLPLSERDPEAARDLLAEAGYPDGLDMILYFPNILNNSDVASVIQSQWAEAGINVQLQAEPESIYYGEGRWLDVDLGITGWGHRPYPQFYLDVMLRCDAVWNEAHFCDQEFDRLADIAGSTPDEAERIEAYAEIQRLLIDRGPLIIPFFFPQLAVHSDAMEGFELNAFSGRTNLSIVSMNR